MLAVYKPGDRKLVSTDTVTTEGVVPLSGETVSQPEFGVVVIENGNVPKALLTVNFCGGVAELPVTPAKDKLVGNRPN
jgi:hypothetical protein